MNIFKFDYFAKAFCISAVLYVYLFILSDLLRLNPNDDGDGGFIGMGFGIFPTIAIIVYILFEKGKKRRVAAGLPLVLLFAILILFIVLNLGDGLPEVVMVLGIFSVFLLRGGVLLIPLVVYLIYAKTRDRVAFGLLVLGLCVIGLSVYPAKDYIQASLSGDPCATKRLIMRGYSEFRTEVYGDVVCIAKDRGYESETYKWEVLQGADAKTFENLDGEYSRDKDSVFYRGREIEADPKTFEIEPEWKAEQMANFIRGGTQYKRDSKNIYFEGQKVPVKDMGQFRLISFCDSYLCGTDGTSIFKEGKIVPGIDMGTLHTFGSCEYAVDKNHAYHSGEIIEEADANSFELYYDSQDKYCYAYDKKYLYYKGKFVTESISSRLEEVNPGDPFSPERDAKNIYYDGKRLDLDINTYQYLGRGVSKDAYSVYHGADKIEEADATTFELIPTPPNVMSVCAKDKNHMYFEGEIDEHPLCTGDVF